MVQINNTNPAEAINNWSPEALHAKLCKLGEDWAEKNSAADLLEEGKKSLLSKLKNESEEKTEAAKERDALASKEYREFMGEMITARKEANKARVRYDSARVWCDLHRSQIALKRAEMELR